MRKDKKNMPSNLKNVLNHPTRPKPKIVFTESHNTSDFASSSANVVNGNIGSNSTNKNLVPATGNNAFCACCDEPLGTKHYSYQMDRKYYRKIYPESPLDNRTYTCRGCYTNIEKLKENDTSIPDEDVASDEEEEEEQSAPSTHKRLRMHEPEAYRSNSITRVVNAKNDAVAHPVIHFAAPANQVDIFLEFRMNYEEKSALVLRKRLDNCILLSELHKIATSIAETEFGQNISVHRICRVQRDCHGIIINEALRDEKVFEDYPLLNKDHIVINVAKVIIKKEC
jgi:hypothetical protein